jgi:lipopolysaccharide export system permease protein
MLGLCTGSFVAIYLTVDFLEKIARFSRAGGSLRHIFLFFLWKIPEMLNQTIPLAVLLATLLTLGILSRNSEITAMRSCGLSLTRISAPILIVSLVVSILSLLSGEFVVPHSYARMKYVEDVLIAKKSINTFFRQNNIWYREGVLILQARLFDPAARSLSGVTLWQNGTGMRPVRRIDAARGSYTGTGWLLEEVVVRDIADNGSVATATRDSLPIPLKLKVEDLKVMEKYADNMGFRDLRIYCRKLEEGGYDATRYRAQMHSRISLPLATLIMAFLGIPFALRSGRSSGIAVGIGISLVIGFSFHIVNALLLSFGQEGVIPPLIAAWAANFIFAGLAVWLTMTVNR